MYSLTSSHSPTLKMANDLAATLLPFKRLLTYIKAEAGAAQLGLPPASAAAGFTERTSTCLVPGIALTLTYHRMEMAGVLEHVQLSCCPESMYQGMTNAWTC